jgi:chaperonin GroEL
MKANQAPQVVFQPTVYRGMQRGINQLVEAIRPTLGPLPRAVAIEHSHGRNRTPELLDSGGIIARRIIELPGRGADAGAMLVRHVLWRVHEDLGDGAATAAVLFQAVYNEGVRYIVSGGNAMLLRRHLEEALRLIIDELDGMATPIEGKEKLAQVAESICYDPLLAEMLGEIFDIIGEYGHVEIRAAQTDELEREYVEGMYWEGGLLIREMITDSNRLRADLTDVSILITDLDLDDPRALLPVLDMAKRSGARALLLVANKSSDTVTGLLRSASREPDEFLVIAAKTPGKASTDRAAALEDMGILTGGRPVLTASGDTLSRVQPKDLGRARRAWADQNYLGVVGGKGDPRALRTHIGNLRAAHEQAREHSARQKLQERIGELMGGTAVLWVGAATEAQVEARKALATRTAGALRGAVREGVVPGGGVALLACRPALQRQLQPAIDADARAAYRILLRAMEAPIRTLLANAGHDASEVMAEVRRAGQGRGFDVRRGEVVDMAEAGIWDVVGVLKGTVHRAVTGAALALSTDVLVHHRKPEQAVEP